MVLLSALLLACACPALGRATTRRAADAPGKLPEVIEWSELIIRHSVLAKGGNFTEEKVDGGATVKACASLCKEKPTCLGFQPIPVDGKNKPTACALYTSFVNFTADGEENDGTGQPVYFQRNNSVASCPDGEFFGFFAESQALSWAGCKKQKADGEECQWAGEYKDVDWTNNNAGCQKGLVCSSTNERCMLDGLGTFQRVARGPAATGGNYTLAVFNGTVHNGTNMTEGESEVMGMEVGMQGECGNHTTNGTNTTEWSVSSCAMACNENHECVAFQVVSSDNDTSSECRLYTNLTGLSVIGNGTFDFYLSKNRSDEACGKDSYLEGVYNSTFADNLDIEIIGCKPLGKAGEPCPTNILNGTLDLSLNSQAGCPTSDEQGCFPHPVGDLMDYLCGPPYTAP